MPVPIATRPTTASRKVSLILFGTLLTLGTGLIIWRHNGRMKDLRNEAYARLGSITGTLGAQFDGGRVTRLLNKYDSRGMLISNMQDAWYYVLHNDLQKAAEANGLGTPLYLVAFDDVNGGPILVATSAERPVLREACTSPSAAAMAAYLQEARIDPERGVWGDEVAAFDPVRDRRGRVTALVHASEPLGNLLATATARLWRDIGLAAALLMVIGAFLLRSVGRIVKREEDAHGLLKKRHEGITDSIAYAGKIQGALVPDASVYAEMFPEHFVLNRPKDTVSGDFHWYHRIDQHTCLVAAADCTGHGLPGAMMAAIGCSLLNEIVTMHPHKDPAELLSLLNERMVSTLHQSGRRMGAGDGMDVALCRIDRERHELLFAGAFRPLYWMHDGQLSVINGDRKPVGGSQHGDHRKYTVHRVAYHEGDRIYLFSDGYVDQFGGPQRQRFMRARFDQMLTAHQHLPMAMQAEVFERAFLDWQGGNEQVDDVCMLGIAV